MDAIKLNKKDAAPVSVVGVIDQLFAIDSRARDEKMDHTCQSCPTPQEAPPLVGKVQDQIVAMSKRTCCPTAPRTTPVPSPNYGRD